MVISKYFIFMYSKQKQILHCRKLQNSGNIWHSVSGHLINVSLIVTFFELCLWPPPTYGKGLTLRAPHAHMLGSSAAVADCACLLFGADSVQSIVQVLGGGFVRENEK